MLLVNQAMKLHAQLYQPAITNLHHDDCLCRHFFFYADSNDMINEMLSLLDDDDHRIYIT